MKNLLLKLVAMIGFLIIFLIGCGIFKAVIPHGTIIYVIWLCVAVKLFKGLMNKS